METELQQAIRIAMRITENTGLGGTALLARVFLAQQARLAEVERERDALSRAAQRNADLATQARIDCREQLAAAERKATEAAWEALTRLSDEARLDLRPNIAQYIREFRDREYPAAPTEREGARKDAPLSCEKAGYCVAPTACKPGVQCFTRPTPPQAAPEPPIVVPVEEYVCRDGRWQWEKPTQQRVVITPELCRRIVETGRASGRGE